jgi:hypothetical protein
MFPLEIYPSQGSWEFPFAPLAMSPFPGADVMSDQKLFLTCDSAGNPLLLDRNGLVIPRSPSPGEYASLGGMCLAEVSGPLGVTLTRVATFPPPGGRSPHAATSFNPWLARGIGLLQTVGGLLEVAGGVGLLVVPEPTMATKAGGAILIVHGVDTLVAGARSLWYGEPAHTLTQQLASSGARELGASETTAGVVGVGVDLVAGLGPSAVVAISRRAALSAATSSAETLSLGFLRNTGRVPTPSGVSSLPTGHVAVGIRQSAGATRWVDAVADTRTGYTVSIRQALHLQGRSRYAITTVAVAAEDSRRAAAAASALTARMGRQQQVWRLLGPNCSTAAAEILRAGQIAIPSGMQFAPYTLYMGLRHGYTITAVGGGVAAMAPDIAQFLRSRY